METLRIAASALTAHKLRSFLTLLGVIIGVMTVVTVVSIIAGLNSYIAEKLFKLNPDVYIVTQWGIITSREEWIEAVKRKPIDWSDVRAVRERCTSCESIGVGLRDSEVVKRGSKELESVRILGSTSNMADIYNLDIEAGRFFIPAEEHRSARVVVIGSDVRDELFGKLDPIGRTIKIDDQPARVIGLLTKQGSAFGESQDKQVYIPITAWAKQFGTRRSLDLFVRAKGGVPGTDRSMDEVRMIIRSRRHTAFRSDDPFAFVSAEALQILWKSISASLFSLMILISGISLVVGGIVIMNIMLVSVVERTREIGVRRAMGATRRGIQLQFLTEATLLALFGGIAGVILGVTIAKAVSTFTPLPTRVEPSLVIAGLGVAVLTGVAAGFFPALRASKLAPVESLRYE